MKKKSEMKIDVFKNENFEYLDKRTRKILMESRESFVPHTPYDYERNLMEAVRNGDMQQAEKWSYLVDTTGKSGTLSKHPLRQSQIMFIAFITMITRAALDGGVLEDLAYAMSDSYIQASESSRTVDYIEKLKKRALGDFVNAVKHRKNSLPYSRAVRKAINFMRSHMQEKITVEMLAEEAGLSKGRFQHLFKEETGVSSMTYLRGEKVESAKAMLTYSDYKIYEISMILGFSSESHFIKIFREYEGITPLEYKKKSQV
jgi:AraC-like DNA-binding protein